MNTTLAFRFHILLYDKILKKFHANINNIKKNDILDFEFPIPFKNGKPDLDEQKRIVNRLDSIFAEVGKGKEKVEKQLVHFDNLKASMLSSVFTKK